MKKREIWKAAGILLAAGLLTGCATQNDKAQTTEIQGTETQVTVNQATEAQVAETLGAEESASEVQGGTYEAKSTSVAGWKITVEDVEKNTSLENVSVELGYTGVETSDYQKEADQGKIFCLIKLLIEKDGSKETIEWDKLKLTDGNGNEYARMEDEFLTDLGMARMTGNTLNFGTNEGWIAFEIDENATDLELEYPFEAENYQCVL